METLWSIFAPRSGRETEATAPPGPAEEAIKDIRPQRRRQRSAEDKLRIVPDRPGGEDSVPDCVAARGLPPGGIFGCSVQFLLAGKLRLAGDKARAGTSDQVKNLRRGA